LKQKHLSSQLMIQWKDVDHASKQQNDI